MFGQANRLFVAHNLLRNREVRTAGGTIFNQLNTVLLRNMSLLLDKTLINGNWVSSGEQLAVLNPANGAVVGHVPDLNASDAQKAVQAANDAFYSDEWTKLTAKDRSGLLKVRMPSLKYSNGYWATVRESLYKFSFDVRRNGFNCWSRIAKRSQKL